MIGLNKTKDKFFSIIAPDLRSPFNGILGFSNILMSEYEDYNDEERLAIIKDIGDSAGKAYKLLDNLLEMTIDADRHSINTIIRNQINNAIKFTENGGAVTIESIHRADFIEISIQDNGVGMTDETMAKLFNIAESSSTNGTNNEKGSGLGLILCKDLIEM